MAYSAISKSSLYFNTKLYTGNGSTNAITGVGFQPDWVWIKSRGDTGWHSSTDAVRGVNKELYQNDTSAEATDTDALTAFGTDGFTVGADNSYNTNNINYASWNWKANGAGSSNSDGSLSATLSANATAGFSVSTFTTPGSGTFTVGHGLGVAPKMVMYRPTGSSSWQVGHDSLGWTNFLALNNDGAGASNTAFGNTAPTTSYWTGNTANVGANAPCVAYCFADVTGYSKFGSYEGNNNADGTFVYTGFKPSFIMFKNIDTAGAYWVIKDNKRSASGGTNENKYVLYPNSNDAEGTNSSGIDLLSNGFKFRESAAGTNQNTIIYMAFGQSLVGSNNVPCTAR